MAQTPEKKTSLTKKSDIKKWLELLSERFGIPFLADYTEQWKYSLIRVLPSGREVVYGPMPLREFYHYMEGIMDGLELCDYPGKELPATALRHSPKTRKGGK